MIASNFPVQRFDSIEDGIAALRGQSGAYVIRSKKTGQVLYVGESHTNRLPTTISRHFSVWNDRTGKLHHVYSRHAVKIEVHPAPASQAIELQNDLICKLGPRDNETAPGCEDPF